MLTRSSPSTFWCFTCQFLPPSSDLAIISSAPQTQRVLPLSVKLVGRNGIEAVHQAEGGADMVVAEHAKNPSETSMSIGTIRLADMHPHHTLNRSKSRLTVPAQVVDATLAWSLSAGVWNPKVFLGR